jgi:hypothetical protein
MVEKIQQAMELIAASGNQRKTAKLGRKPKIWIEHDYSI